MPKYAVVVEIEMEAPNNTTAVDKAWRFVQNKPKATVISVRKKNA